MIKFNPSTKIFNLTPFSFFKQPHDIDHVIPKKLKKEMQLQTKQKDKNQEVENLPNLKDVIQHRPAPRNVLSVKEKMENLKLCIDKIQSLKDTKKKNDLKSARLNHEIKPKSDVTSDKQLKEKKMPEKRGRKKKVIDS